MIMAFTTPSRQENLKVAFEDRMIDATISYPTTSNFNGYAVVLTHGATGDMNQADLVVLSNHLTARGFLCCRFTYLSSKVENRMRAYQAVVENLQGLREYALQGCFVAGRSMGSRAAVMLANASTPVSEFIKGVVCLAYPLHPPGKLSSLRKDILVSLRKPALFVSGTKDSFCKKPLFEDTLKELTCDHKVLWLDGGDHGFKVKGQRGEETMLEICQTVDKWFTDIADIAGRESGNAHTVEISERPENNKPQKRKNAARNAKGQKRMKEC